MALRIENISKNFGATEVLRDISLFTEDGEFLALLGPSGSGKTTLLRVIAGLELPDAGAVRFRDEDLLARPVRERRIGFVFQHYALFKHMTATQNIAFGMNAKPRKRRSSKRAIREKVAELLALVQLDGFGGRYPSQLSGGQRQRVALARALAIEPDVLLLDEPLGALDPMVRASLQTELKEIFQRLGQTVLMVTHDMAEAGFLGDTIVLMNEGRIRQQGTLADLRERPTEPFVTEFLNAQRSLVQL